MSIRELTKTEIAFFRSQGYLIAPTFFDKNHTEAVRRYVKNIVESGSVPFGYDESTGKEKKAYNLFDASPEFEKIFKANEIITPLRGLLGNNIEFVKNRHNHASIIAKGMNQRRFHRDILHWTRSVITVLIYLQDTSKENGATEVIPGSQYFEFIPHSGRSDHGGTWLDEHECYKYLDQQALPIPITQGGILFLDSLAFHTPGINYTDSIRIALTASYRAVDELSNVFDPSVELVSGERPYCGNDYSCSGAING